MDGHRHFKRFKRAHKFSMALAQRIEQSPSTLPPNGQGASKTLQEVKHLPDKLPLWYHIREYLWKGWDPVVVNKHVDSVTMPKWIASAILVAMLGFGVSSWWRASDQRDMLIELRTELRIAKQHEAERAQELKEQAEINKVYIDNMTNQLNTIKGMLSMQQLNAIEQSQKRSN